VVLETVVIELCRLKGLVEVTDALASAESGRPLEPHPAPKVAPAAYRAPAPTNASKSEEVYKPVAVSKLPPAEVGEPVLAVSEIEEPADSNEDPHLTALKSQWREVLEKVGALKKGLQGILTDCRPKSLDRDTLVVVCKSPFHQDHIQLPENKRLVEQVVSAIANTPLKLVAVLPDHMTPAVKTESGVVKPHAHPKVDVQALQKDEPLVKAVMEMFDGKVVDVIRTKGPTA
jgi:hypothetical protein